MTDSEGSYRLAGLHAGMARFVVSKEGYEDRVVGDDDRRGRAARCRAGSLRVELARRRRPHRLAAATNSCPKAPRRQTNVRRTALVPRPCPAGLAAIGCA